jgi:DNA-directed RNA polymerase subunit RPC12/RpoP
MDSISTPITISTAGTSDINKYKYVIPSPYANSAILDKHIEADELSEKAIEQIKRLFSAKPLVEYACHNCGAKLQLEPEDHIFKCKYCGSVYMVVLD